MSWRGVLGLYLFFFRSRRIPRARSAGREGFSGLWPDFLILMLDYQFIPIVWNR